MLCLFPKSLVMCGEQLLHSPYLQAMCALTVGLGLDQVLCHHPTPPHHTGNMPSTGLHLYSSSVTIIPSLLILTKQFIVIWQTYF